MRASVKSAEFSHVGSVVEFEAAIVEDNFIDAGSWRSIDASCLLPFADCFERVTDRLQDEGQRINEKADHQSGESECKCLATLEPRDKTSRARAREEIVMRPECALSLCF